MEVKEGWRVLCSAQIHVWVAVLVLSTPESKCIAKCEGKLPKKEGHPIGMALRQG
jgi:hypothetical protein